MSETWIRVAQAAAVPEDGTFLVEVGSEPICLYNVAGKVYATHDHCTHAQVSLADGFVCGEHIECPLHQGQFHIPTGKAVGIPCTIDLQTYETKVEQGAIYVKVPPVQAG